MENNDYGINEAEALPITPYYPTHFLLGTQISVINRNNNDETASAPTQLNNTMDHVSFPDEHLCSHGSTKRVEDLCVDDFLKFHDSPILTDANLSMEIGYTITSIRVLPCRKFVEIIFTLSENDSTTRQRAQLPPRPQSSSRSNCKSAKKSSQKGGGGHSTNQRMSNVEEMTTSLCFECSVEFPFFDVRKGWSSFSPVKTTNLYGLECRQLQVGDTCILLIK